MLSLQCLIVCIASTPVLRTDASVLVEASCSILDRQAWLPILAVGADGTIALTYYDFRKNTPAPGALAD